MNKRNDLDLAFVENNETYRNKLCDNVRFPNDENINHMSSEVHTYMLSKEEIERLYK